MINQMPYCTIGQIGSCHPTIIIGTLALAVLAYFVIKAIIADTKTENAKRELIELQIENYIPPRPPMKGTAGKKN